MIFLFSSFLQIGSKKGNLVLGVDIGSHTIKIVEFQQVGNNKLLRRIGRALTPEGLIEDGVIKDLSALSRILSGLINNFQPKLKKGATSISGFSTIIKRIDIPFTDLTDIELNLYNEAEKYVPFEMTDIYLDFHIIKKSEGIKAATEIFLVAAKKDIVDSFAELLQSSGVFPAVVDVDPFAMSNAFEIVYGIQDKVVALIDIGAQKSNINIIHKGESLFARDIPLGGNQITREMMDITGIDFNSAEAIKIKGSDEPEIVKELGLTFHEMLLMWGAEFKKAIDFYNSSPIRIDGVSEVYLSGGCALMNGIDKIFEEALDIPVFIFDPFKNCIIDKTIDPEYLNNIAPQMTIAAGLASRVV